MTYSIKIKSENGFRFVFDNIRRKWLKLTPEEKVRQFFIKYLVERKHYPLANIAVEMGITINGLKRRADIVVYKSGQPYVVIECKAEHIRLGQETVEQVANYNHSLNVNYLVVTNGKQVYILARGGESAGFEIIQELPDYN